MRGSFLEVSVVMAFVRVAVVVVKVEFACWDVFLVEKDGAFIELLLWFSGNPMTW